MTRYSEEEYRQGFLMDVFEGKCSMADYDAWRRHVDAEMDAEDRQHKAARRKAAKITLAVIAGLVLWFGNLNGWFQPSEETPGYYCGTSVGDCG